MKAIETVYRGYRFRGTDAPSEPKKRISVRANLAGRTFGRLRVRECLGVAKRGWRWWGCACDCGELVAVNSRELIREHTKSCGCFQMETARRMGGCNKLSEGEASRNELIASYKKSAKSRGHDWCISDELAVHLLSGDCVYCGVSPNKERKPNKGVNGGFWYTGIDRVDPSMGYVDENVVSCCWDCNRAKGRMSVGQFKSWIRRLAARQARFEHGQVGAPGQWKRAP